MTNHFFFILYFSLLENEKDYVVRNADIVIYEEKLKNCIQGAECLISRTKRIKESVNLYNE